MKRNLFQVFLFLVLAVVCTGTIHAQLSGTYTINAASPTSGTNFASFADVSFALRTNGVSGPVVINVVANSGPYNEQAKFYTIPGASSSNTIVINGNGNTITFNAIASNRAILWLKGAQYMTFNDLNIVSNSVDYGYGIFLNQNANNNIFKSCTIDLTMVSNSSSLNSGGIIASADSNSMAVLGSNANYCRFEDNLIKGGPGGMYVGVRMNGNIGVTGCVGNVFKNNIIQDFYSYGMYFNYTSNTVVEGTDIKRPNKVSTTTFYGIFMASSNNAQIFKNKIHNTHDMTSFFVTSYGIFLSNCQSTAGAPIKLYNNLIYKFNCDATISALNVISCSYVQIYYNTVSLDYTAATALATARGFNLSGANSNIEFKNNLISITHGGTGDKHAVYIIGSGIVMDYNAYYLNPPTGNNFYLGNFGAINYQTLTNWQTANGASFDQNSKYDNPGFVQPAIGNLTPASGVLDNKATPIAGIGTDITGSARHGTTPDPGAFEFTAPPNDAGIVQFSSPLAACPGIQTLKAVLKNFGASPLDSVTINWRVNGVVQPAVFYTNSLLPGETDTVSLGNVSMSAGLLYDFISYTSSPNGAADAGTLNDTSKWIGRKTALSGVFTIGPTGNYPNIIAAAQDLNNYGVCGPVVFNVLSSSGPYIGRVEIGPVSGVSSFNTVTFNGNGNTISFNGTSFERATLVLRNADYFTFNNFVIQCTNSTNAFGIFMTEGCEYNVINGCTMDLTAVTSTSTTSTGGVYFGSTETSTFSNGPSASFCEIRNCTFLGGNTGVYYGVVMIGGTGSIGCEGNLIQDNQFIDIYSSNIYLQYTRGTRIIGNDISRAGKVNAGGTFFGVYFNTGNIGSLVEKNEIHDTHNSASLPNGSAYGVYINNSDGTASEPHVVRNNLFYNFNGSGIVIGVQSTSSDFVDIYFNTFSFDHAAATSGITRGIYTIGVSAGMNIKNNLISITRGGSGDKYGLFYGGTGTLNSDHNNVYIFSSGGGQFYGYYGSSNYGTLASWQAIGGGILDQNSKAVNPKFVSIANDNYKPNSNPMNNGGTPIGGISDDILGVPRNGTSPDIGAIEYTPVPDNDSCLSAIVIVAGTTTGSTILSKQDFAPTCTVSNDISGGVWYKYTGRGHFVNLSLCTNTSFNTQVRVFEGTCNNLTCVTGNNDFCGTQSEVNWCAQPNVVYYILIHGYAGAEGEFEINLTENPIAKPQITASGPTNFCEGGNVILTSSLALTYQWNDPANSQTKSISVSQAGSYKVAVIDTNGCESTSNSFIVTTMPLPFVDLGPDFYFCIRDERTTILPAVGGTYGYSWSTGATTPTIIFDAQAAGFGSHTISLMVTDNNGCQKTDEVVIDVVSCTGIEEYGDGIAFKVIPNPNNGRFELEASSETIEPRWVEINDAQGRVVYRGILEKQTSTNRFTINLDKLPKGMYMIYLRSGSTIGHQRFVVE